MIRTAALVTICMALAACASSSRNVEPINVPMGPYMTLSCDELKGEQKAVSDQIEKVSQYIDDAPFGSRLAMGVGVVFWPALFLVDGKGDAQDKLAQLKGQRISIEDAILEHNCARQRDDLRTRQSVPQASNEQRSRAPAL